MNKTGKQGGKAASGILLFMAVMSLMAMLCFGAAAQTTDLSQHKARFVQLVQSGQLEQAYQLASDLETELAGDPDFDFAYGRIAISVGQFDSAVFALERVVTEMPQWPLARFTLAQAYFQTKNYPAALRQLEWFELNPVPDLQQPVATLSQAAEQAQTRLKGHLKQRLRYAFGQDSNVNSGTAEERIFIPSIGEIDVFPQSKASSDAFHQFNYSLDGRWQQDQRYAWLADIQLGATGFQQLSEFNRETLAARLGFEAEYQHFKYNLRAYSKPLRLDGQWYRNDWGAQLSGEYQWSEQHSFALQWVSGQSDNRLDDRLNLRLNAVTASWEKKGSSWIHQAALQLSSERSMLAKANYNSRDLGSVSYTGIWLASAAHVFIVRAEWQDIRYKAPHPLFLQVRDETMLMVMGSWNWQYSKAVSTEFRCGYTDKKSPLTLYQYNRTECVMGVNYAF